MVEELSNDELVSIQASADCLFTESEVNAALDRVANDITKELSGTKPLVLCTMIGGIIVTGKLLERLDFPLSVDYIHASRYRGALHGAELDWIARPTESLKERVVLIVDDIFDEGLTLEALINDCLSLGAKKVFSAILLDKSCQKKAAVDVDFVGMKVDNRYVFGCGMDYKGYLRNASGIYAIPDVE